jgi:hypothetical protein
MMSDDAYFKLMGHARQLTGEFNGPIARLIEVGYVTSQTIAIRRLCDKRQDVISLRRVLDAAKDLAPKTKIDQLNAQLDRCGHVCDLVNNYVVHTANPLRRPDLSEWNLQVAHLTEAQRAICEVAITLDRDLLQRKNYVKIIPVPQDNIMKEFQLWASGDVIIKLWEFWHLHNNTVNAWIVAGAD